MRISSARTVGLSLLLLSLCALAPAAASARGAKTLNVQGPFADPAGSCADLQVHDDTGLISCSGTTDLQGGLVGGTNWSSTFAFTDRGYQHGTVSEVFDGRAGKRKGKLRFLETLTSDPQGNFVIEADVIGGSGDFKGATGHLTFDGVTQPDFANTGTYSGKLKLPKKG